jgi:type I restriction enzyme R subunit
MPNPLTEYHSVQNPIINYVSQIGWNKVSQETALNLRRGEGGLLFYDILAERLKALNPGLVDDSNVGDIIKRIENARSTIEGNREVLRWIKGEQTVFSTEQNRELNVTVVDFENPQNPNKNNVFHVTSEWQYTNGRFTNRADIVFLINGIPVVLVETKAAQKKNGAEDGIKQVRRYHRETPEMVTQPQVFDVPNIVDFYYGVTWNLEIKNLFNWKDEEKGNFEKKVKAFFEKKRFLKTIQSYILFFEKDDEVNKIILRQHQTRAVEKVTDRCKDKKKPRGLVWHTQGSGKTFTMITVAEHLLTRPEFEKPTVVMLVDRNELEGQLSGWLRAFKGIDIPPAESKEHLRELLRNDYRGLIVTTIHKFDKIPPNLNKRENIFVLVDEAHRTTTGDLGNYLVGALPNATLIGFTGTPIDRTAHGKGTFKVFGLYDEKGYLDKYSIKESIEDGTTIPLKYTLAPNKVQVPKEKLEKEFYSLAETEGVSDIEDLNRILDRAVNLKNFLKAEDRVDKVSRFVADHFKNNVEPLGYKAFLVGVDREACVLLKEALDKCLPTDYSKIVYTPAHNDDEKLKRYYLSEDEEKKVRKEFVRPDSLPKILIVTEKLLTGFDAPILYCMYLDKPMRDHTLLQAIARVNRPYEQLKDEKRIEKPCGMIVDFIGIFDNVEKALAFDSDIVASVIENLDLLKKRFGELMRSTATEYLKLLKGASGDKIVERIIKLVENPKDREKFFQFYKELETLYEIISPDVFLRPYIDDYLELSKMYEVAVNAKSMRPIMDLMKKTEELVRKNVTLEELTGTLRLHKIDEDTLEAIKKEDSSDNSKVINLAKSLVNSIDEEEGSKPFLVSISERAGAVVEALYDRQTSTRDALKFIEKLIEEYNQAKREMAAKKMNTQTFSAYWILKQAGVKNPEVVAAQVEGLLKRFPNWQLNVAEFRALRAELYTVFIPAVGKERMAELVKKLLHALRGGVAE